MFIFQVFANFGLSKVGAPFSQERLNADLDHLDTFYLGEGWSRDGPPGVRQLDYYSGSFAIQISQLIYSKLANDVDPKRCEEYRDRGRKFAVDFVHYFDNEGTVVTSTPLAILTKITRRVGRAIPFGRSMTYRFAMSAFWGALAFADVLPPAPLSWGTIKGLLLRNLRYWSTQPAILSPSGILTLGFVYPSTYATENYNSPGSPYWAFLAFLPLAVPEDHPFWSDPEEALPISSTDAVKVLDHPGHIISHLTAHTFLISSGQACHYPLRHGAEKYGKLAYSAPWGYAVPTGALGLDQHAPDSTIALSADGGESWKVRREVEWAKLERDEGSGLAWLRASWKPKGIDVEIETWLLPPTRETPDWHVRIHRIQLGSTRLGKILVSDAGFSIHGQGQDGRALAPSFLGEGLTGGNGEGKAVEAQPASALVRSQVGLSGVVDLTLHTPPPPSAETKPERTGETVILDANASIVFPRSVMPTLMSEIGTPEKEVWLVTGVFAVAEDGSKEKGLNLEERWRKRPSVPWNVILGEEK